MPDRTMLKPHAAETGAWVDAVANRALAVVAARKAGGQRKLDSELLSMMRHCLLNGDRAACEVTVTTMTGAGVTKEEIADLYIPALARQLGDEWCEDEISFADVTIGSSKLQSLLRELGPDWRADHRSPNSAHSALVLVESGESHTLGAQVLAGRLRRDGFSVKVKLSADPGEVAEAFRSTSYDIIFISTSRCEALPSVTKLVDIVRKNCSNSAPVIVGGALDVHIADIRALTGADLVTSNIEEALQFCGLSTPRPEDVQPSRRE